MIRRILIFGATGDLTNRYLVPALARLGEIGRLPEGLEVSGLARDDWDTESFRRYTRRSGSPPTPPTSQTSSAAGS